MLSRTLRWSILPLLLVATPVIAGPPWITIEYPGNPFDPQARDAFLVVHAFHHNTPAGLPVSGTAEGIVDGKRRTIALQFQALKREGAFALRKQWPNEGRWLLALHVTQGAGDWNTATALVQLAADGSVASTVVPSKAGERGMRLPMPVSRADVEAAIAKLAAAER
ncbi:MAG: hypothetical protein HYV19_10665 [Gemmatimonadetes bacterium]|nr:hypothetical protein [Gemmatimonadota bacterium]